MLQIEIPQLGRILRDVPSGANLLAVLVNAGIPIARSCAGEGVCGTCHVDLSGEGVPPPTDFELRLQKRLKGTERTQRMSCLIQTPQLSKKWVLRTNYW